MKPEYFTRPFVVRTALLAGAGAAGEQTADHGGSELGEANPPQIPCILVYMVYVMYIPGMFGT